MFRSIQRNGTTKASNDVVVVCDIVVARSQMFDGAKYISGGTQSTTTFCSDHIECHSENHR